MKAALLCLVTLAFTASAAEESSQPAESQPGLKPNAMADGRRPRNSYGAAGYQQAPPATYAYQPPPPPPPHIVPAYIPPVIDRNLCDLDASVLVVVEHHRRHRHGSNVARRLKCSDIAAADEDSCTVCCQNAARRDPSIKNEDIFGFLTVVDHFEHYDSGSHSREHYDDSDEHDDYVRARREKREADAAYEQPEASPPASPPVAPVEEQPAAPITTVVGQPEGDASYSRKGGCSKLDDFKPDKQYRNLKCLCCAPRRNLPPPPPPPVFYPQPIPYPQQPPSTGYSSPGYPPVPVAAAASASYSASAPVSPPAAPPASSPGIYNM